jgi:hypothetical protein
LTYLLKYDFHRQNICENQTETIVPEDETIDI